MITKSYMPKTLAETVDEMRYIQSVDPSDPGPAHYNDPFYFGRYRLLQANAARRAGRSHKPSATGGPAAGAIG